MPLAIQWLVVGLCLVTAIAVGLATCFAIVGYFMNRKAESREDYTRLRMLNAIHTLDRWCCYDFPIVEEISEYLTHAANQDGGMDIDSFREKLRGKYGSRTSRKPITLS